MSSRPVRSPEPPRMIRDRRIAFALLVPPPVGARTCTAATVVARLVSRAGDPPVHGERLPPRCTPAPTQRGGATVTSPADAGPDPEVWEPQPPELLPPW